MEAKLSSKNQIVIPRQARTALQIEPGDKILVVVRGNVVILLPKVKKYSEAIRGIGKGVYPSGYLRKERKSWR